MGVLAKGALLPAVYDRDPHFWKLPSQDQAPHLPPYVQKRSERSHDAHEGVQMARGTSDFANSPSHCLLTGLQLHKRSAISRHIPELRNQENHRSFPELLKEGCAAQFMAHCLILHS